MKDDMKTLINAQRSAIMGAAEIWIAVYHLWLTPENAVVFEYFKKIGFVGVDIFFLLSGMGLVYSIEKRSTLAFYGHRLKRVFLPFAATAVVFCILQGWSMGMLIRNVLCINFYTQHIMAFLWNIPALLTLYLFFPLYYWTFRHARYKGWFTFAMVLVWLWLSLLVKNNPIPSAYFGRTGMFLFTNRIPIFLTGIYLGWRLKENKLELSLWGWGACAVVFCLGLYYLDQTHFHGKYLLVPGSYCFLPTYLMAISGVPLMAKGADLLEKFGRIPGKVILRVFAFFGRISLEFYCVHEYVGMVLIDLMGGLAPRLVVNMTMFAVSTVGALILEAGCKFVCRITARLCDRKAAVS